MPLNETKIPKAPTARVCTLATISKVLIFGKNDKEHVAVPAMRAIGPNGIVRVADGIRDHGTLRLTANVTRRAKRPDNRKVPADYSGLASFTTGERLACP